MDTDLSRDAGSEVRFQVGIPCAITVSCQTYVGMPNARDPDLDAIAYAEKAQSSLSLPSVLAELRAAGIAVIRPEGVLNISEVIADAFVSRANLDVVFGATLNLEEFTGYIDKVEAESKELGISGIYGNVSAAKGSIDSESGVDGTLTT
jgi:hypothetical protein